jgi:hypothetical protein
VYEIGVFKVAEMLGQNRMASMVGGRCSAVSIDRMRQIRDQKLFLAVAETWEEFCPKFLGISKTQANRLIQMLNDYGPQYFELAQLTRVTVEEYKTIAPAMTNNGLAWNGEEIELVPENAEKLAAAVVELRKIAASRAPAQPTTAERLKKMERRTYDVVNQLRKLVDTKPQGHDLKSLIHIIRVTSEELQSLVSELPA